MSNTNNKNRLPDYYVQLAQQGRHGKEKLTDVGAVWEGKNGYLTGETIAGRIILQPRDQREEYLKMKGETQDAGDQGPTQEVKQSM